MKSVVLLALVGLASCRTTLIGADRAQDVSLEYSYIDERGELMTVEVEADRLGLGLVKKAPAAPPAPTQYVQLRASPLPVATKYIQVAPPAPVVQNTVYQTRIVEVPVTKYIQVAAAPVPTPKPQVVTRYVYIDDDDDDDDKLPVLKVAKPVAAVRKVEIDDDSLEK